MRIWSLLALALLAGCKTSSKAELLSAAFDSPKRRHDLFEANLRVLDQNPGYVDEFFALARHHPKTLGRFAENQSRALDDEKLAAMTARHLVAHPASLRTVMEQSMDAASGNPAAKKAIAEAIDSRAETAATIMVDDPASLAAVTRALAAKAVHDKDAREQIKHGLGEALKGR
jgi:hypothetical protein